MNGDKPNRSQSVSTFLVTLGAFITALPSLEIDTIGFMLTWANNFSQAVQNFYIAKFNAKDMVTPFEINFFFACVGLFVTLIYNFVLTSNYEQLILLASNPETGSNFLTLVSISSFLGIA